MSSPSFKRRKSSKASSTRENMMQIGAASSSQRRQQEVIEIDDSSSSSSEDNRSSQTGKMKSKSLTAQKQTKTGAPKKSVSANSSNNKKGQSPTVGSPTTIKVSREQRLNKRQRERKYDELEVVVNMSDDDNDDDACDVSDMDKIEAYKMRGGVHNTGGEDDNDLLANNLKYVSPKVNMPLEICDNDFIWSSAKIHKISNSKKKCNVTVRYEGWGSEWDEVLPYPNTRLARIFTYTKRVRCLGVVLAKKKEVRGVGATAQAAPNNIRNWTDVWPCTVSFRMPHPGSRGNNEPSPEDLLSLENNIFVQPYAPHLLSPFLQKGLLRGGWWVSTAHLRLWKDFDIQNPLAMNSNGCVLRELSSTESAASQQVEFHFPQNFIEAYQVAKADRWICGRLPPKALTSGSLLDERYRVQNVGGDAVNGINYTGAFDLRNAKKKRSDVPSRSPSPVPPPKSETSMTEKDKSSLSITETTVSRPTPILIHHEHAGVRRLPNSNRWASVVKIAGNDVFLGTFSSQTEALHAREMALAQCPRKTGGDATKRISSQKDQAVVGLAADLLTLPVETVIQSFEESKASMPFRLSNLVTDKKQHLPAELQTMLSGMTKTRDKKIKRKQATPKQKIPTTNN